MLDKPPDKIGVELAPHRAEWAAMARAETQRLHSALGPVLLRVEHIGSTSIPGILAKPIVDLIPVVSDLSALDAHEADIRALGYLWYGELGIPTRRYCTLTDAATGKRVFQLHCFAHDSPQIARHVAFRNYLRAHPALAKEYEAEKMRAAAQHPDSTLDYNDAKNDWIKRVEREALEWVSRSPAP